MTVVIIGESGNPGVADLILGEPVYGYELGAFGDYERAVIIPGGKAVKSEGEGIHFLSETVSEDELMITSYRRGEEPGYHSIVYDSEIDTVQLSHNSKNRKGLALGAVLAAEFIQGKKGFFEMKDMLDF